MTGRRPAGALAAACAVVLGVLAGCVAIPTSGPATVGIDAEEREAGGVVAIAQGPQADADPVGIVEGFLVATDAEVTSNFDVTREFLAADERSRWNPGAETIVVSAQKVEQTGEAQVTVSLSVTAKVDAEGRYQETPVDALETLRYELVQDARGDWRISHAPDVLVVSSRRFAQQFRETTLQFLTPDKKMLVPEVRWFRNLNVPTAVVRALLAGPSPWLRDSVTTAFPPEVVLKPEAVSGEPGALAEMVLEPAGLVLDADRGLVLAQLTQSLRSLNVPGVAVRAGAGGPLLEGTPAALRQVEASTLEMLVGGQVTALTDAGPEPVEGVGPVVGAQPSGAARSADGSVRVALADPQTLVSVAVPGSAQRTLLTGPALAAPSVDRYAWVWTSRGTTSGHLDAVRLDGAAVEVTAEWLAGRTVTSLRVSRDGTRIAVVSRGADGVALDVAGIRRDREGVPITLGDALRTGAAMTPTTSVVWVDDRTLGVLADGDVGPTPYLVPVSGPSRPLPAVPDAVEVAAGRGDRTLHVVTSQGEVLRHDGGSWAVVPGVTGVLPVTDASFPG